ncbi:hypothetical protein Leryth_001455 [Lithospermum erythrorhizon]|nr:hypothetical protein Leryth_001455 [Lithospermum erythrorhizon]
MAMKAFYMFLLQLLFAGALSLNFSFTHNGFLKANLSLYGDSYVTPDGILTITNDSTKIQGHAFYPLPIQMKESSDAIINSSALAFSTTFVFSIKPKYPGLGGHGFSFVLFNTKEPKGSLGNQFLGLPFNSSITKPSTCFLAVEFDTVQNYEFGDLNDNHVGIDICSLTSSGSQAAAYYLDDATNNNISIILKNGDTIQAWIEYYYNSQEKMQLNVTISPLGVQKPKKPLISLPVDLSTIIGEFMYVGFSASTGVLAEAHDILGWSFRTGGTAQDLALSQLPSFDQRPKQAMRHMKGFVIGITTTTLVLAVFAVYGAINILRRVNPMNETLEDWEMEYGTRRFRYSELHSATKGFVEESVIGTGGFGKVYKGVISSSGLEVAIKKVAHDSRQGMREFVAEITSMGHLRHRNLVQLHGWCRRQDELLLVYDYVPNGSLDNLLYNTQLIVLTWDQRHNILVGIAQGLLYLHEECNQLILHRDVKPSNVLIDEDLNPKLGDFGLARIYEHGIYPQTTHIVGTLGYLAPELTKTGRATAATDVYGYGALMLEVVCGRRPIEPQCVAEEVVLVDWVRELHFQGEINRAVHPSMVGKNNVYEIELMLNLGLLCTHAQPEYRPSMRRVVEVLVGDSELPTFPPDLNIEPADHGVIAVFDVGTHQNTSLDRATSSKSSSFSDFHKISPKHASRITF